MIKIKWLGLLIGMCYILGCDTPNIPPLKLGIDVLMESKLYLIKGKRVGVITNQTGVNSQGQHVIDLLFNAPDVQLAAIFAPEHGIRGDVEGGYQIDDQKDAKTGVPILSLYGATKKPTPEMLRNIDVLIFDIQDVGARFYTYISTMSLCMEAAAEQDIEFLILDRPNPITGIIVEGPVLDRAYQSFVGIHPIALRHGMTIGELALLFNDEGWLANGVRARLSVIPMENWKRDRWYEELNLRWIKPSPNMPSPTTALLYPGMGLLESCNIAEGRGTTRPFEQIGAPWLDHATVARELSAAQIQGVAIDTISFTPVDMPGMAMNPKYEGQQCKGLLFTVKSPHQFEAVRLAVHLIEIVKKLHPDRFQWNSTRAPLLMFGDASVVAAIDQGKDPDEIIQLWQGKLNEFRDLRAKYLLYE